MGVIYKNTNINIHLIKQMLARQYGKNRFIKLGAAFSNIEKRLKITDEDVADAIKLLRIHENSNMRVEKYLTDQYIGKYKYKNY